MRLASGVGPSWRRFESSSLRLVLMVIGVMVMVLSAAMLAPAVLDAAEGNGESSSAFFISSILCMFVGGATAFANR